MYKFARLLRYNKPSNIDTTKILQDECCQNHGDEFRAKKQALSERNILDGIGFPAPILHPVLKAKRKVAKKEETKAKETVPHPRILYSV